MPSRRPPRRLSVQSPLPDAATPEPAPAAIRKKPAGPEVTVPGVRIDPAGVHLGDGNGLNFIVPPNRGVSGLSELAGLMAITAPFLTLVVIFAIVLHFRNQRRRMLHETLRAMIEKAQPIPPELLDGGIEANGSRLARSAHRDLRGGLVLLGVGIVLYGISGKWGLIPCVIGVALLIVWCFERWERSRHATTKP